MQPILSSSSSKTNWSFFFIQINCFPQDVWHHLQKCCWLTLINTAPPAAGILVLSPSILTNNALPVMWWCQIQRYTLWPRVLGKSFARHLHFVLFILHVWMFLNHHEADSYFVAVVFCDNSVSSVVSLQDGIPAVLQRTHRLLLSHWRHLHWITLHSWPSCVLITSPVL